MTSSDFGRVTQLDGIRTIAVGMVIVAHSGLSWLVPGGFGVTIFFFLSGFLITSLLRSENARDGTISLSDFYIRRVLRIMPPLYITLVFCWIIVQLKLVSGQPLIALSVFSQFTFFVNYASIWGDPLGYGGLPITSVWSLAVEEHYYLVFPVFYLVFLRKLSPRDQIMICLMVCALALAFRFLNVAMLQDYTVNYRWTHTRIDSIMLGAGLALYGNPVMDKAAWRPNGWYALTAVAMIGLSLAVRDPIFRETVRYSIQNASLYVLFAYALSNEGWVAQALSSSISKAIARYSYTLYLVHSPMFGIFEKVEFLPHIVAVALALASSWIFADLMFRLVERPLAQWRRNAVHRRMMNPKHQPHAQGQ